ncbi:MAG: hypothetical protein WBN75_04555 [Verrucomicrobiia bacterium]|jgi:tetratricopeptide (TPR) repeat protein
MSEDINQEILTELRKPRRSNQTVVFVACFVLIVVTFISRQKPSSQEHSWTAVDTAMKQLDYPKALYLTQANVARHPNYYYGHSYLGFIYLAMDDLTNSEAEYLRAYELFPSEQNEKDLAAIRKRVATAHETQLLAR